MDGEAGRRKINTDIARKKRQFADPNHGYTDDELDELCRLCEEHSCAFGVTLVYKLLTIKSRKQRETFQRRAITNRWTLAELEVELRRRFGRRGKGGRKPKAPASKDEALVQLDSMSLTWTRWYDALATDPSLDTPAKSGPRITVEDLPPPVQAQLKKIQRLLKQLRREVEHELQGDTEA